MLSGRQTSAETVMNSLFTNLVFVSGFTADVERRIKEIQLTNCTCIKNNFDALAVRIALNSVSTDCLKITCEEHCNWLSPVISPLSDLFNSQRNLFGDEEQKINVTFDCKSSYYGKEHEECQMRRLILSNNRK